jgi:DNA-binding NarL/FixJ family response regulator
LTTSGIAERTAAWASLPGKAGILIVDDHPMTRFGISQLLDGQPDLLVGAEAKDSVEAMDFIQRHPIDLVIADISLPGRNGLELIKDALALRPALKILVCSMYDELLYGERALRAGARGFIMKDEGGLALLRAIREVLRGQAYLGGRLAARMRTPGRPTGSGPREPAVERLSDRELEIFNLLGQGRRSAEIATLLHLSVKTVDTHRANMREKLDLPNGAALAFYATHWIATTV